MKATIATTMARRSDEIAGAPIGSWPCPIGTIETAAMAM